MKYLRNSVFVITCLIVVPHLMRAQEYDKSNLHSISINDSNMVAELIVPFYKKQEKLPAIIALGGSEGGIPYNKTLMDSLALQGYIVLRLSYFKSDGLPNELQEIPFEYFENALEFLLKHESVDKKKIGLLGSSKGAEAALILASKRSEIKAVVAHVPSHVVWQGISRNVMQPASSWTMNGKALSFVPYGKPDVGWQTKRIADYYEAGLNQFSNEAKEAVIEVEKIAGHILITSAGKDKMWPSKMMAEKIILRLEGNQFTYEKEHLHFPEASHLIFAKISDVKNFQSQLSFLGGELEASLDAQEKSIKATFTFFDKHLKNLSE